MGKGRGKGMGKGGRDQQASATDLDKDEAVNYRGQKILAGEALEARLAKPLWTLYGQTIDLEAFAKVHPGGELHLRLGQGVDACEKLYESYHVRNDKHHAVLKKWGVTAPKDPSPFHADLKKMVQDYEVEHGTIKATWLHCGIIASFGALTLLCAYGWAMGSLLGLVFLPFFSWLTFINSSHDASHSAFSSRPWVNNVMTWTATPLFYLPYCWYGQHVVSHHTHTNEEEFDLDLHHFHGTKVHPDGETPAKLGPVPLWKVSLQAHWLLATIAMSYIYPLQHLAAAIGSALSGTPIDIATTGDSRRTPHFKHMKHWELQFIVEPIVLFAPWVYAVLFLDRPILFCTYPYVVAGLLFMGATQISHIQEQCQAQKVLDEKDWIKRQAMTSLDYAVDSDLWRYLTGGLNTQALHHSLPPVCSCHFTALYRPFLEVCKKHNVHVPLRASLKQAMEEHWHYLSALNGDELLSTLQHIHDHHD